MKKRKLLRHLVLLLVLCYAMSAFVTPFSASAASCGGVDTSIIECQEGGDGGIYHILALVVNIFSIGVGILAVIGISWSGVQYLTAGGNEEKVTKAKRRLYEIIIGVVSYTLLWAAISWLLPGGVFNLDIDNTGVESVEISYSGETKVGKTFRPDVKLNGSDVKDNTYSLVSDNKEIAKTLGYGVKCIANGSVGITALSANGMSATMTAKCDGSTDDTSGTSSTGNVPGKTKASDGSPTVENQMSTKVKGNHPHLRKETKNIVSKRSEDFYAETYDSVIKSKKYGSYKKYVKSLGGVFADYADVDRIRVKTAADFQAAAEYVFGLLEIWGPDYRSDHSVLWPGNDAFYAHEDSGLREDRWYHYRNESINKVLKYSGKSYNNTSGLYSINVNCNKTIDIFVKSTTLKYKGYRKGGRRITKVSDLRVGDVVHGPGHIFIVGEVYKNKVVFYDGGSRLQQSKTYKQTITRTNNNEMGGWYKYQGNWTAYRPWKIDQSVTLKGISW